VLEKIEQVFESLKDARLLCVTLKVLQYVNTSIMTARGQELITTLMAITSPEPTIVRCMKTIIVILLPHTGEYTLQNRSLILSKDLSLIAPQDLDECYYDLVCVNDNYQLLWEISAGDDKPLYDYHCIDITQYGSSS
jgi:hypothetical protein